MRTIEAVKANYTKILARALKRPGMYLGESLISEYLQLLCFIDEKEELYKCELDKFVKKGTKSNSGVAGAFEMILGKYQRDAHDVASIYAELAFKLGYLKLTHFLTNLEYSTACKRSDSLSKKDWTTLGIIDELGTPSWSNCNPNRHYSCTFVYTTENPIEQWIFFDFWNDFSKIETHPPQLRNIRIPSNKFKNSFKFTPFGTQLLNKIPESSNISQPH